MINQISEKSCKNRWLGINYMAWYPSCSWAICCGLIDNDKNFQSAMKLRGISLLI